MTKYEPLSSFLKHLDKSEVRLGFDEVEKILGAPLPRSAYDHQAWWANNPKGHSHCQAWYLAGWRTENLNLSRKTVVFKRVSGQRHDPSAAASPLDPWGALAGTVKIHDEAALTSPSGEVWDAER